MSILPSVIKDTSCFPQSNLNKPSLGNHDDPLPCSSSNDDQSHILPNPHTHQYASSGTLVAVAEKPDGFPKMTSEIRKVEETMNSYVLDNASNPLPSSEVQSVQFVTSKKEPLNAAASSRAKQTGGCSSNDGHLIASGRRAQSKNANYLLNFSYDPIVRSYSRTSIVRNHRKLKPYNRDLFLQANYKFVVLDTGDDSSEVVDPDKLNQWETIICLKYLSASSVQCPICLDEPLCSQITSCGHIFCFPCILQYLLLGYENDAVNSLKRCPLCFTLISVKSLCTIYVESVNQYKVGDTIDFLLLDRAKDSLIPGHRSKQEEDWMEKSNDDNPFSKYTISNDVDLVMRKAVSDLDCWLARADSGLVDDIEKLPFVTAAMKQLHERKKYWSELCVNGRNESRNRTNDLATTPTSKEALIQDNHLTEMGSPEREHKTLDIHNLRSCISEIEHDHSSDRDSYHFYQACDGQNIILHPLNMKCLLHHYGSYDLLPNRIRGKIVQLETVSQSEATRRRYRFLSHFSLTTTYQLCEISLSGIIPQRSLQPFADEIKKRDKQRKTLAYKEKKEKVKADVAAAAAAADSLKIASFSGQFSHSAAPQFSMDDFKALGNSSTMLSSSPTLGDKSSFSDVTRLGYAAGHDSPALRNDSNAHDEYALTSSSSQKTGTLSFANVISSSSSRGKSGDNGESSKIIDKKGRKQTKLLMSISSGRRY